MANAGLETKEQQRKCYYVGSTYIQGIVLSLNRVSFLRIIVMILPQMRAPRRGAPKTTSIIASQQCPCQPCRILYTDACMLPHNTDVPRKSEAPGRARAERMSLLPTLTDWSGLLLQFEQDSFFGGKSQHVRDSQRTPSPRKPPSRNSPFFFPSRIAAECCVTSAPTPDVRRPSVLTMTKDKGKKR